MRVYINNRDLLTWPAAMANHLAARGHEVVFVDNESSYPPLLEYYASCPHRVIELGINAGAGGPWLLPEITKATTPFVVTDPDLDISTVPDDWPEVLAEGLARWPMYSKAGLSLEDRGVPSTNPAHVLDGFYTEGNPKYWHQGIERIGIKCSYYHYPIDTTFALYRDGGPHRIDGTRTGRPYTARHLPFHLVPEVSDEDSYQIPLNDELIYYFDHAKSNAFGRYSTTVTRMQPMLEQFRRSSNSKTPA